MIYFLFHLVLEHQQENNKSEMISHITFQLGNIYILGPLESEVTHI